ncbi:HET-domain-containing protein, partial [Trametes versicolor FP-101664 SS1]|uniref:HET-domain-containing protein n=1 Tax=Trametes versicolor (strain FP-101664) TaxID=717944 RepID=UPI0004623448
MGFARQHIDECVREHEGCKHLSTPPPLLPTRLVDCTDPAHPRLVFTSRKRGEYLALSYVWGADQFHKAMKSTVLLYVEGFDSRILPRTIHDAIFVTHALKFQYLWVDALCITQDDGIDRQHEIGHMHHIYRHATLTIFAACTASASDGFIYEGELPDPWDLSWSALSLSLPFICPPSSTSAGFRDGSPVSQLQLGYIHLRPPSRIDLEYHRSLGVMATRAWCMQEYLLSPRALIFTADRLLLFKCRTNIRGVGNSVHCFDDTEPRLPDVLFLRDPPAAEPGSKEWIDTRIAWLEVVRDYSGRSATLESDKLVACAAVAQRFARVLGCDYLAGFWRSDTLLNDLLWKSLADMPPRRRVPRPPPAYLAPSWSWAAAQAVTYRAVTYGFRTNIHETKGLRPEYIALAEIIPNRCEVTLKDPSLLFGEVTGGTLVLR